MTNPELLERVEKYVSEVFKSNPNEIYHHQRTAYWIKQLKPDADEALLIAGMSHDIERAFEGDWKAGSDDPDKLKKHQELSASFVATFLTEQNAPTDFVEKVKELIRHHEEGGTEEQNILCDADCLAYFEEKAIRNAKKAKTQNKAEQFKTRLGYVFSRIHSDKAKAIATKWYIQALEELK